MILSISDDKQEILRYADLFFSGGNCWLSMNRNGRCTSLVKTGVSREECCDSGSQMANSATASWSDGELLTPSSIFFMHVQGGVPCTRCKGKIYFYKSLLGPVLNLNCKKNLIYSIKSSN